MSSIPSQCVVSALSVLTLVMRVDAERLSSVTDECLRAASKAMTAHLRWGTLGIRYIEGVGERNRLLERQIGLAVSYMHQDQQRGYWLDHVAQGFAIAEIKLYHPDYTHLHSPQHTGTEFMDAWWIVHGDGENVAWKGITPDEQHEAQCLAARAQGMWCVWSDANGRARDWTMRKTPGVPSPTDFGGMSLCH